MAVVGDMARELAAVPAVKQGHDHGVCVKTLIERAREAFGEKGLKLTALRVRVLEEIAASHDAMGAYDVIDRLAQKTGDRIAPISVYRAIDALQQAGLVHRLESRNAFFACHAPHLNRQRHMALVCEICAEVVEVPAVALYETIDVASRMKAFMLKSAIVEGFGVCAACQALLPAAQAEGRP